MVRSPFVRIPVSASVLLCASLLLSILNPCRAGAQNGVQVAIRSDGGSFSFDRGQAFTLTADATFPQGCSEHAAIYSWTLDDKPLPNHGRALALRFDSEGDHLVACQVATKEGCNGNDGKHVIILSGGSGGGGCTLTGSATPNPACIGQDITFTASATGAGCNGTFSWVFDDGPTVYNGATVHHSFATAGTHKGTVTYSGGGSLDVFVTVNTATVTGVSISANPNPVCAGTSVTFSASANASCGTLTYTWTFGDGATGTGQTVTHTYASAGLYTVTVTASTGFASASTSITETVNGPSISFTSITVQSSPSCVGEAVTFTANATLLCGTGTLSYSWTFGDGGTATGNPATHAYAAAGTYTVICTVTGAGVSASRTVSVTINAPAIQNLVANGPSSSVCVNSPASFSASASDACPRATITYTWHFDDGTADQTGPSVQHTFTTAGTHVTTVTASDGTASAMATATAAINPASLAITSVTANPSPANTCDIITFNANTTSACLSGSVSYSWNFEGTAVSGGASTTHQFLTPGLKHVTVTVTSGSLSATGSVDVNVSQCTTAKDPAPGNPPGDNQPQVCVGGAAINVRTGNAFYSISDPVPTRGWPLMCNINVSTQVVELNRPMGQIAFTYDIHLDDQNKVFDTNCNGTLHMFVVDGDGTRLDFGPVGGPYSAPPGCFSHLTAQGNGYVLSGAGPPEHISSAGNFTYAFVGKQLTQITDPAGNFQQLAYAGPGLYLVTDLSTGKSLSFTWTGSYISRVTQNGGQEYSDLSYSGNQLTQVAIKNSGGTTLATHTFTWTNGRINTVVKDGDPNSTITFTYAPWPSLNCASPTYMTSGSAGTNIPQIARGVMPPPGATESINVINNKGGVTRYDFNGVGDCVKVTTPPLNSDAGPTIVYTFAYNGNHEVTSASDGYRSVSLGYTDLGLLNSFHDENNQIWSAAYNAADLTQVVDPLNHQDNIAYNETTNPPQPNQPHVPTSFTDSSGYKWNLTHNANGQILSVAPPAGSPTSPLLITYDENANSPTKGYPLSITDGNGDPASIDAYDALGDVLQFSTYPIHGNTTTRNSISLGYDAMQRPTYVLYPDGKSFQWSYTGRNLGYTLDEAGTVFNFSWCSPCGALTGVSGPLGWTLGWNYDGDGDLSVFTDARGKQTSYTFGKARELQQITYPDGSTVKMTYGAAQDNYTSFVTNGRNQKMQVSFTNDGKFSGINQPNGGLLQSGVSYNQVGSVYQVLDALQQFNTASYVYTTFTYYPNGLVQSVVYNCSAAAFWNYQSVVEELDYTYNPDSSRASVTWKNNGAVVGTWNYNYDPGGRLTSVSNSWNETTSWGYDGEGKLKTQSNSNGTNVAYAFNEARGWPTQITNKQGANPFAQYTLAYDNGLNTVGNLTGVAELNGSTDVFGYDALYRLTSEQRTGSNPLTHSYGYDLAGNRTNVDGTGFTFDNANKPTGTYITNDLDGNLLTGGTFGYLHLSWDPYNRLLSQYYQYPYNLVGRYEYDGLGHRFADWPYSGGGQKRIFYVFDGDLLLGEIQADQLNGAGVYPITANTWGAAGLVCERLVNQSRSLWYAFGPQGETRQLTDSVGNVVDTYIFTAYGAPVASTGTDYNPHRFGGQFGCYTDPYASQDMILCGARWYNASLGRWLSRDPSGYDGGANLYEYCVSAPTSYIDYDGQVPKWLRNLGDLYCGFMHGAGDDFAGDIPVLKYVTPTYWGRKLILGVLPNPKSSCGTAGYNIGKWGTTAALFFIPGGGARTAESKLLVPLEEEALLIIEKHHLLPKQFRKLFEAVGFDIDLEEYIVRLGREMHKRIHGKGGGDAWLNSWNQQWKRFFGAPGERTAAEILEKLAEMRRHFGI